MRPARPRATEIFTELARRYDFGDAFDVPSMETLIGNVIEPAVSPMRS